MTARVDNDPDARRLAALVAQCEREPGGLAVIRAEGDKLATAHGGVLGLRWGIAVLRACIASPGELQRDPDEVRELYGELVDRHREDPAAMATLRELGEVIRARESDGRLARTMVARSERGPRKT